MTPELIFYPSVAMFALTLAMMLRMGVARYRATASREVSLKYYRLYTEGAEPEHLRLLSRHVQNHFEVPPLFHLVVLMLYVTGQVSLLGLIIAWLYVALRCLHSYVHLVGNVVPRRFAVFIASGLALLALWLLFFVGLLTR